MSASGSPRRKIAAGRASPAATSSFLIRQMRRQPGADRRLIARTRKFVGQNLVETLSRRIDDELDTALGGNLRALLGDTRRRGPGRRARRPGRCPSPAARSTRAPAPAGRSSRASCGASPRRLHEIAVEGVELLLDLLDTSSALYGRAGESISACLPILVESMWAPSFSYSRRSRTCRRRCRWSPSAWMARRRSPRAGSAT